MIRLLVRLMEISLLSATVLAWGAADARAQPATPKAPAGSAPREFEVSDEQLDLPALAVARIGGSLFSAPDEPASLAVSPDGRVLAVAGVAREVCLFDTKTGRRIVALDGAQDGNLQVSFSVDGRQLAAAGSDGKVRIWNLATGAKVEFVAHSDSVRYVGFLPTLNKLVTVGADQTLRFWDAGKFEMQKSYNCGDGAGDRRVAVDPRLGCVYFVSSTRVVRWEPKGGKPFEVRSRHTPHALQLADESKLLCVVSLGPEWAEAALQIFDTATARELKTVPSGRFRFSSAALSPDGKRLAVGCSGPIGDPVASVVRMLDWRTGRAIWERELTDCVGPECVTFSADGQKIFVCFAGNLIRVFDAAGGSELLARRHECCEVMSVTFGATGQSLLIASGTDVKDQRGRLSLWDLSDGQCRAKWQIDCGYTTSAALAPDEQRLIAHDLDGRLLLRDASDGHVLWEDRSRMGPNSSISRKIFFRPGGKDFVLPQMSGAVSLIDVQKGANIASGSTPPTIHDAALSGRGTTLALAKSDASVALWNVEDARPIAALEEHSAKVLCVAFAPADQFLVSGGRDTKLRVWDLSNGRTRLELVGHKSGVVAVGVSPDGKTIISGDETGDMIVWDVRDGRVLNRWMNEGPVTSLSFSPRGDRLACANRRGRVLIWDYEKLRVPGAQVGVAPNGRALR